MSFCVRVCVCVCVRSAQRACLCVSIYVFVYIYIYIYNYDCYEGWYAMKHQNRNTIMIMIKILPQKEFLTRCIYKVLNAQKTKCKIIIYFK